MDSVEKMRLSAAIEGGGEICIIRVFVLRLFFFIKLEKMTSAPGGR